MHPAAAIRPRPKDLTISVPCKADPIHTQEPTMGPAACHYIWRNGANILESQWRLACPSSLTPTIVPVPWSARVRHGCRPSASSWPGVPVLPCSLAPRSRFQRWRGVCTRAHAQKRQYVKPAHSSHKLAEGQHRAEPRCRPSNDTVCDLPGALALYCRPVEVHAVLPEQVIHVAQQLIRVAVRAVAPDGVVTDDHLERPPASGHRSFHRPRRAPAQREEVSRTVVAEGIQGISRTPRRQGAGRGAGNSVKESTSSRPLRWPCQRASLPVSEPSTCTSEFPW
eukprot:scaffold34_cov271-Prasinococcus_capsulatus_cf.AAC.10